MNLINDIQQLINEGRVTENEIIQTIKEIRVSGNINYDIIEEDDSFDFNEIPDEEKGNRFWELSEDTQTAIAYIFDMLDPLAVKNRLCRYSKHNIFKERMGWNQKRFHRVKQEIQEYLAERMIA